MVGVLLRIRELMDYLNPTERRVAEYILKNSGTIVGQPIADLAMNSQTNKAAVIRFCKSIGCSGYRDFTYQLTAELAVNKSRENEEYTDINIGDSVDSILKSVCYNNVKAIEDSCSLLKAEEVKCAAEMLIHANRIDFYGLGASWIVAQDAMYKFIRINKNCSAYADPHLQMTSAFNLSEKDVVVAISWSGETKDIIEATRQAKESGASVITITRCGKNHLSYYADVMFYLTASETTIRIGAMSSRAAQMTMIDILYSCVVNKDYSNIQRYLKRTRPVAPSKRLEKEK